MCLIWIGCYLFVFFCDCDFVWMFFGCLVMNIGNVFGMVLFFFFLLYGLG